MNVPDWLAILADHPGQPIDQRRQVAVSETRDLVRYMMDSMSVLLACFIMFIWSSLKSKEH